MSTTLGGRYQLVREIGAGGMGRVFQAIDTQTKATVAAKVMLVSLENNLEALLRFQQEGTVLSTIRHPNIVEVYATFLEGDTSCIIMELLQGRSLAQILRFEGRLPLSRVKHLAYQVTSALAYAHQRAIVHRDVKPDNIMVIVGDQVKVTDFGIARILRDNATLNTATGMTIGTPLYMAPEQIEGQKVDGRADIYSFGAVLYEVVTGRPPFEGNDPLTVAFKHVHRAPQPPSEINADIPADWERLILKALAKDPADRFQTAGALEAAVGGLYPGQPGDAAFAPTVVEEHDGKRHPASAGRVPPGGAVPGPAGDTREPAQAPAEGIVQPQSRDPRPPAGPTPATFDQRRPSGAWPVDSDATVVRVPPQIPAGTHAPASAAQPYRPATQPGTGTKRPVPWAAIAGGLIALLLVVGAALFVLRGSGKKENPTPVPTARTTTSLIASGTQNAVSGHRVKLQWAALPHATAYRLEVATAAIDPNDLTIFKHPILTRVTTGTSYALRVVGRQYYYWRVQAEVAGKWNPYSASQHFSVARPVIAKPVPLSPKNGTRSTAKRIRLCWSGVKGASDYMLHVAGSGYRQVRGTCTWIPVHPGRYRWRVAARVKAARLYTGPYSVRAHFAIDKPVVKPTATPVPTAAPTAAPPTAAPPTAAPPTAAPAPTVAPTTAPAPTAYVPPPTTPPQPTVAPTTPPLCKVSC